MIKHKKKTVYEEITERIIDSLEAGVKGQYDVRRMHRLGTFIAVENCRNWEERGGWRKNKKRGSQMNGCPLVWKELTDYLPTVFSVVK